MPLRYLKNPQRTNYSSAGKDVRGKTREVSQLPSDELSPPYFREAPQRLPSLDVIQKQRHALVARSHADLREAARLTFTNGASSSAYKQTDAYLRNREQNFQQQELNRAQERAAFGKRLKTALSVMSASAKIARSGKDFSTGETPPWKDPNRMKDVRNPSISDELSKSQHRMIDETLNDIRKRYRAGTPLRAKLNVGKDTMSLEKAEMRLKAKVNEHAAIREIQNQEINAQIHQNEETEYGIMGSAIAGKYQPIRPLEAFIEKPRGPQARPQVDSRDRETGNERGL